MAAFSLSNWVQATTISAVHRDRYPNVTPSESSDVKHCKEVNTHIYGADIWLIEPTEHCKFDKFGGELLNNSPLVEC